MEKEIRLGLRKIIVENFSMIELDDSLSNCDEFDIDSINYIKLLVYLEDEFDFAFLDEDLSYNKFRSIESLTKYICQIKGINI